MDLHSNVTLFSGIEERDLRRREPEDTYRKCGDIKANLDKLIHDYSSKEYLTHYKRLN